jgi:UDP-N-acetylglucosamine 2-epimerase (non-hydrolysing)
MTEVSKTFLDDDMRGSIARLSQEPIWRFDRQGAGGPIVHIVGARPNFVKLGPLHDALKGLGQSIVHTGQHYDHKMSESFFEALGIAKPDVNLAIGTGRHSEQTARIMIALEERFEQQPPCAVVVYGDVNSTLAASLVAAKMRIPCIHVEAGLRSGDRDMPEEINRLVTDRLSDLLFAPSPEAAQTLINEGVAPHAVYCVGNIMIDTLARLLPQIDAAAPPVPNLPERFVLVTLHRPSNVDAPEQLTRILDTLERIARDVPVVFPVHPRTRARMAGMARYMLNENITLIEPQDYLSFIWLQRHAAAVITDSGGIQEETTWLGKPCLTLRDTTERPVTVDVGTNLLLGRDPAALLPAVHDVLEGRAKTGRIPDLWDGATAQRIRAIIDALNLQRGR